MEHLTLHELLDLATWLFAVVNVSRAALVWLEGIIVIWLPRTSQSGFWLFWLHLMQTLDYVSLSLPRQMAALRQFSHWRAGQRLPTAEIIQLRRAPVTPPTDKGGNDAA